MKTQTLEIQRILARRASGIVFGLLLFVSLTAITLAQPSPVGNTWDCVMSGSRGGIAYLTFNDDGTFEGFEIIVPNPPVSIRPSLIHWDVGSNGLGVRPSATNRPNLYGYLPVQGPWGFDSKGRVIGFFIEVGVNTTCVTNVIPLSTNTFLSSDPITQTITFADNTFCVTSPLATNTAGTFINRTICYTNAANCAALTNTINFVGKVVPGKRLTLLCSTLLGRVTWRSVPSVTLGDIGGPWYGIKTQNRMSAFEFFALTDFLTTKNTYLVSGAGAGYSYTNGVAVLSSQKKVALAFDVMAGTSYQSTRAVIGPFNSRNFTARTTGIDTPPGLGGLTNRVTFRITKRTSLP